MEYKYTGNSVANYKESTHTCKSCKGQGRELLTKDQLWEIMDNTTEEYAIKVYKIWRRDNGYVDCPDCFGLGTWTNRS